MTNQTQLAQSPRIVGTFPQLATVLGALPTAIAVVDTDMRYLMVNQQWIDDYRLGHIVDVINQSHYELVPDLPEVWKQLYRRALQGESFSNPEDRYDRMDGSVTYLSWRVLPWFNETSSQPAGIILISQDITRGVAKQINREVRLSESADIVRQRMEILSRVTSALAEAKDEHEILSSLTPVIESCQIDASILFYTEIDEDNELLSLSAVSAQSMSSESLFPVGTSPLSLELGRLPAFKALLGNQEEPIFLTDVFADPRFDVGSQPERAFVKSLGFSTLALLPLKTGTRWQSVLCFGWLDHRAEDSETQDLFKAIMPPTTSIVAARRAHLSHEEERAHTEAQAMVNAILFRATNEDELLAALAAYTDFSSLALDYIDSDETGSPSAIVRAATWKDRLPWPEAPELHKRFALDNVAIAPLWLQSTDAVLRIEDTETDSRLSAEMKTALAQQGTRSAVLIALQGAGTWQGLITLGWEAPHSFTKIDRFIYEDLSQTAASLVTSRRAYLAEEAARRSSQILLQISTEVSQATTEDDILAALAVYTEEQAAVAIHLHFVDADDAGQPIELKTVASRKHGKAWLDNPAFDRPVKLAENSRFHTLFESPDSLLFIGNLDTHTTIDGTLRQMLCAEDHRSLVAIPLLSSGRWQGLLTVHWNEPRSLSEDERHIFAALAVTLSAVVASRRLYIQTLENVVRLRDLDTLKNEFMSSMSHELRTPLNAVIGLTDIILNGLDGPLTPKVEIDIRTVYNAGQHLLAIVNDVLDLAKIEAGHLQLIMAEMNVQEPILEALETASIMAESKGLKLLNTVPTNLAPVVADTARVRQVLLNLLSNAIKFTEQGSVEVSGKVDQDQLTLWVRDEGIGIDPQHHTLIFEQFRQVAGALTRKKGGTGLGLPISKRLIELHGGKMWLESDLGKGCTFYFSLPLA